MSTRTSASTRGYTREYSSVWEDKTQKNFGCETFGLASRVLTNEYSSMASIYSFEALVRTASRLPGKELEPRTEPLVPQLEPNLNLNLNRTAGSVRFGPGSDALPDRTAASLHHSPDPFERSLLVTAAAASLVYHRVLRTNSVFCRNQSYSQDTFARVPRPQHARHRSGIVVREDRCGVGAYCGDEEFRQQDGGMLCYVMLCYVHR